MALLEWKSSHSVGVEAVDHEHRELIDLINTLHDRLMGKSDPESIKAFFGDLLAGITAHFALEERFMREHGYDQLRQHKGDHEHLLDEIREIMEDFEVNQQGNEALSMRLERWFARHFETHDARLHHRLGAHPH